jgi:copper homeostasis protein
VTLEVCIDSVESAIAAQEGGADRVELCADLDHGGVTPSIGLTRAVRGHVSLKVHVMIRPRAGDFCYSHLECDVMKNDIEAMKALGVDGVVVGVLTREATIDVVRMSEFVGLARPLSITFHRAFDDCVDPVAALTDLRRLGVDRILTSGGQPSAEAGVETLAALVHAGASSVRIIAGGGITLRNVSDVIAKSGVDEIHVLSAVSGNREVSPPHSKYFHATRHVVDTARVREMSRILRQTRSAR